MTNEQWEKLLGIINGKVADDLPVGSIIDSPWLPNWAQISILDYFADGRLWSDSDLKAIEQFPDIMFLPGICLRWVWIFLTSVLTIQLPK
jgi:hypothetical protein